VSHPLDLSCITAVLTKHGRFHSVSSICSRRVLHYSCDKDPFHDETQRVTHNLSDFLQNGMPVIVKNVLMLSPEPHRHYRLGFEVLTAMKLSVLVFWVLTLCGLMEYGESVFLRKVSNCLQVHTALRPKRPTSTDTLSVCAVLRSGLEPRGSELTWYIVSVE
jgi:hypothetical protein